MIKQFFFTIDMTIVKKKNIYTVSTSFSSISQHPEQLDIQWYLQNKSFNVIEVAQYHQPSKQIWPTVPTQNFTLKCRRSTIKKCCLLLFKVRGTCKYTVNCPSNLFYSMTHCQMTKVVLQNMFCQITNAQIVKWNINNQFQKVKL